MIKEKIVTEFKLKKIKNKINSSSACFNFIDFFINSFMLRRDI